MTEQQWITALKKRRRQLRLQMRMDFKASDALFENDHRFEEIRMITRILKSYKQT